MNLTIFGSRGVTAHNSSNLLPERYPENNVIMGKLTDLAVIKLRPGPKRREIADGTSGLYLIIQPTGAKSWALRFREKGKSFKVT